MLYGQASPQAGDLYETDGTYSRTWDGDAAGPVVKTATVDGKEVLTWAWTTWAGRASATYIPVDEALHYMLDEADDYEAKDRLYGQYGIVLKVDPSKYATGNSTVKLDIKGGDYRIDWGDKSRDSRTTHTYKDGDRDYRIVVRGHNITKLAQALDEDEESWGKCILGIIQMALPTGCNLAGVFRGCSNIDSWDGLQLPQGTTAIPDNAYRGSNIAPTDWPEGITTLGKYCYSGTGAAFTTIPGHVHLQDYSLEGTSLAATALPLGIVLGEGVFRNSTIALTELPQDWTAVPKATFEGCTATAIEELPEGLTAIGDSAFKGTATTGTLVIPTGVDTIGEDAFAGTTLSTVEFAGTPTSIGAGAFPSTAQILAPWSEDDIEGAPWGAGSVVYDYAPEDEGPEQPEA
jgi:hypothetical protein